MCSDGRGGYGRCTRSYVSRGEPEVWCTGFEHELFPLTGTSFAMTIARRGSAPSDSERNETAEQSTRPARPVELFVAFELSRSSRKLASTTDESARKRCRGMDARDLPGEHRELRRAKREFGLPSDAPVSSCFEAGRDVFWIHRYLFAARGIENVVVDAASIELSYSLRKRLCEAGSLELCSWALFTCCDAETAATIPRRTRSSNPARERSRRRCCPRWRKHCCPGSASGC